MKLVTCLYEGQERVGLLATGGTLEKPATEAVFLPYPDMNALIEAAAANPKAVPQAPPTMCMKLATLSRTKRME